MKPRTQKQEELNRGRELMEKSQAVLLFDFSNVKTAELRRLRQELKRASSPMLVIKKRLLSLLFKERGLVDLPLGDMKTPTVSVFASNLEEAAGSVYRFFAGLEKDRKIKAAKAKFLGGCDLEKKEFIPAEQIVFIGQLPPREVLLAQLLGMLAAPIRSFLCVLSEKSKQTT